MLNVRRYLNILGEAKKIIEEFGLFPDDSDPDYKAAVTVYETAFRQLLKSGLCAEFKNGNAVISTDGETFVLRMTKPAGMSSWTGKKGETKPYDEFSPFVNDKKSVEPETRQSNREKDKFAENPAGVKNSDIEEFDEDDDTTADNTESVTEDSAAQDRPADKTEDVVPANGQGEPALSSETEPVSEDDLADDYGMEETVRTVKREKKTEDIEGGTAYGQQEESAEEYINGDDPYQSDDAEVYSEEVPEEPQEKEDEEDAFDTDPETETVHNEENINNKADPDENAGEQGEDAVEYNAEIMEGVETHYDKAPAVEMPDHMHKRDFTFNFSEVTITGADGKKASVQLIIAPLSISEEAPRILVCAIEEDVSRTIVSETNSCIVRVKGFPVNIRGWMDGDTFKSSCTLQKRFVEEGARIEVNTMDFGKKGHIALEDKEENVQIHIIPATFVNNASGSADYIYYIFNNGEEIVGDTGTKKAANISYGGNEYDVTCKWDNEGVLYSSVRLKEG